MSRKFIHLLVVMALALGMPASVFAQVGEEPELPTVDVSALALETPVEIATELASASGEVQIVVRLLDEPLAAAVGQGAKQKGAKLNPGQQRAYVQRVDRKQSDLMAQIAALGGVELGRVSKALNAVIVSVDAAQVSQIAGLPGVRSVRPLGTYELDLSETVPYIGASSVQAAGFDGSGVTVAVLDSGIDYLHANLGGSGSVAEYLANDPTIIEPGTFPTWKVVGGYDFVGGLWPTFGPLMPDPDPLDDGTDGGHGTHVADIIGGLGGVAPGASLYAVKVCSSVSTSCSGVALLQGMDFALDPNMDGDISDAVDVINMSLGSSYGQKEDDLGYASTVAVQFGVVVVVSAGNSADRPFIVGSPSSTPEVISVAQTNVPSAILPQMEIVSPAAIAGLYQAAFQPWSAPLTTVIEAQVQYGDGAGGNLNGCAPFAPGSLTGKIGLVDRGACNFTLKIKNVGDAGGVVGVIGLVTSGDPFGGGDGGDRPITIPGFMITQAASNAIKAQLAGGETVIARFDPAVGVPLIGSMVGTSSRGPSYSYSQIKPDIGAPGASVSAIYGSGTGTGPFGGTSGAAPMVSGSAALLVQAYPGRAPAEIKSVLMNTGETEIYTNPLTNPGELAPITRIGGGEVRVDRALAANTAAWDAEDMAGSLSFGYNALTGSKTFTRKVVLRNYSDQAVTYSVTPNFRYADDAASGAVTVVVPNSVKVRANSAAEFKVQLKVDVTKLPLWNLYGGGVQGTGSLLQGVEFDGYLDIMGGGDSIHMAWQILPHRAAEVAPASNNLGLAGGEGTLMLDNSGGAVDGWVDVFSLLGTSGRIPPPSLPEAGDNFAVIDIKEFGVRQAGSNVIQFGISTFGTRSHPAYPAEFDIFIDTNRDGVDDFVLWNQELSGFGATGQTVVYVGNLATNTAGAYYYAAADLRSGNMIFTAPMSVMGLTAGTTFDVSVYVFDNYFTGWDSLDDSTDSIVGMTYTLGAPRYVSPLAFAVPAGGSLNVPVVANPDGDALSPSQSGLLLLYGDAREQHESDPIYVTP